ncbi:spermatogenesis-associated protein 4 [Polypterus senegalus]|uniref:spermatogenesis-associated protein 4 n=1 Tax=Polypterus senegalus TaxID=55291 RepID=UPI0019647A41|nr:spermatogenesis-associated protein 4 [Polypterus senegalus]
MSGFYPQPPKKTGVPREVLKWLQSLDLSFFPKNVRRDFSNGYLVAEVCSWYFPEEVPMHAYDNRASLPTKLGNWALIEKVLSKRGIHLPKEVIEGTIHCKPGAAELLVQELYCRLTNREIKALQYEGTDFTDRQYQEKLPMVARSTASKAIKNNITLSETLHETNIETNKSKAQAIIHMHLQQRQLERVQDPKRFSVKPTLGELAIRLPPTVQQEVTTETRGQEPPKSPQPEIRSRSHIQFREIDVRQTSKRSLVSASPISGD